MEEQFSVEDLLDFPNDDASPADDLFEPSAAGASPDPSALSSHSAASGTEPPPFTGNSDFRSLPDVLFPGDEFSVPCEDLELQWLSNLVEESFSTEDLQKLRLLSGVKPPTHSSSSSETPPPAARSQAPMLRPGVPVPGKARSKRPRTAPRDLSSRVVPQPPAPAASGKRASKGAAERGGGRRCLHCASETTPQWRTGPAGPKTLCNACGVRYKSGRLVPEYRPAASPTYAPLQHSNSHRKVMELRKRKGVEIGLLRPGEQLVCRNTVFCVSDGGDFLIRH